MREENLDYIAGGQAVGRGGLQRAALSAGRTDTGCLLYYLNYETLRARIGLVLPYALQRLC